MKKFLLILLIILNCTFTISAIIPAYFGARSLSMGFASSAFNYDINAVFINPALLGSVQYSLSGYQYQNSYLDYCGFISNLNEVIDANLIDFESLNFSEKEALIAKISDIFGSKYGVSGFSSSIPGFISKNYGFSVSFINTAVVNPVTTDIGDININDITNADISGLKFDFIGLSYSRYSGSYAFAMSQTIKFGVSLHYLTGTITEFEESILSDVFSSDLGSSDYLEYSWGKAETKFNKLIADFAMSVDIGAFFKFAIVIKNYSSPVITTPIREISVPQRIIGGISFRPDQQWGIYIDMDLEATEQFYNEKEVQPFSVGIEKSFFKNQFFVRAGLHNDLTEKYFFGEKSNVLYGFGIGFNMGKIIVDTAIAMDNSGRITNLAISAFFMVR